MKAKVLLPAALLLSLAGAANAQLVVYGLLDGSYGKSVADDILDLKADFHSAVATTATPKATRPAGSA